jgi:hypothetical protein
MTWRRTLAAALAALVAGAAGLTLAHAQGDLTGEWEIRLTTQTGVTTWQARFEQDGDRLGGEIDLGDNEILDVDGTVDGAKLAFIIVVPDLDGDQPIDFEGELTGDTIQGAPGSFSWYGTGDWEASRK